MKLYDQLCYDLYRIAVNAYWEMGMGKEVSSKMSFAQKSYLVDDRSKQRFYLRLHDAKQVGLDVEYYIDEDWNGKFMVYIQDSIMIPIGVGCDLVVHSGRSMCFNLTDIYTNEAEDYVLKKWLPRIEQVISSFQYIWATKHPNSLLFKRLIKPLMDEDVLVEPKVKLNDICPEIFEHIIFSYLSFQDIRSLKLSCKDLSQLQYINEDKIYREMPDIMDYLSKIDDKVKECNEITLAKIPSQRPNQFGGMIYPYQPQGHEEIDDLLSSLNYYVNRKNLTFPDHFPDYHVRVPFMQGQPDTFFTCFWFDQSNEQTVKKIIKRWNKEFDHEIVPLMMSYIKTRTHDRFGNRNDNPSDLKHARLFYYDLTEEKELTYDKDLRMVHPLKLPFYKLFQKKVERITFIDLLDAIHSYT